MERTVCERRSNTDYWIGLIKVPPTVWLDGSSSRYRSWASHGPDSSAQCFTYKDKEFFGKSCDSEYRYACKKGICNLFSPIIV